MNQITFSFSKFNSVFLPKLLLMCIPGMVFVIVTFCALKGKIGAISSSGGIAVFVSVVMFISMIMLVLAIPSYLSRLSQYRNSYIIKQGDEVVFYKCANNLPILDEKTKIYTAKDITKVSIKNKEICIVGNIEEVHRTRHGNEYIGEIKELKIPDVFNNTNILVKKEN